MIYYTWNIENSIPCGYSYGLEKNLEKPRICHIKNISNE
jgi:hypothetical protein